MVIVEKSIVAFEGDAHRQRPSLDVGKIEEPARGETMNSVSREAGQFLKRFVSDQAKVSPVTDIPLEDIDEVIGYFPRDRGVHLEKCSYVLFRFSFHCDSVLLGGWLVKAM